MASDERLSRVAKGKRPRYFSDPAIDKLHAIVMSLVGELSATRDRVDALERLLDDRGAVSRADVDAYAPDELADAERQERRDAYIRRVMRVVEMELDQVDGRRDNATFDAEYAALLEDEPEL